MKSRINAAVGVLGYILLAAGPVMAGGFALQEQSVDGLGQSFAGATTGFGDGSSAFFNPAATLQLDSDLIHAGAHLVIPFANYDDDGSSLASALGGGPVNGGEGGNAGELGVVPNLYLVKLFNDGKASLAFSANSPFGLSSKYDSDWVGRYHAVKSELITVNLNPSAAVRLTDWLSVGAGVSAMYSEAELTNAVDFGTIGVSALGPSSAAQLGLSPQAADGFANIQGDDWGYGYNVGALVEVGETKFGVHYRSRVKLRLDGDAEFTVPTNAQILTSTGSFVDTGAEAAADLPETVQFDLTHAVNEDLHVSFGALWTRWTRLPEIRVTYDSAQDDSVTPLAWDNSWRLATGFEYAVSEKARFRSGLAWEQTPISSSGFRTPRIPDNDRWWATLGVSLLMSERLTLDLAYAHLFVLDAGINVDSPTGNTLRGDYDLSVDIVSAALTWRL